MQKAISTTSKQQDEQPYLVWDYENSVQYGLEGYDEFYNEGVPKEKQIHGEELVAAILSNESYFESEWEYLTESLTELMNQINPKNLPWKATVRNFGWRKLNGSSEIDASDGEEFLRLLLPDTECQYRIFDRKDHIAIQNWHHDNPTGDEWYRAEPITQ